MQNEAEKRDIKSMLPEELERELRELGQPAYRARQIFEWLSGGVASFGDMSNLPAALREDLGGRFYLTPPELVLKRESERDGTQKYLWRLRDGESIESVVMRYESWNTVCISSQAGCRMSCAFCASAIGGFKRNLTASEMLDQVLCSERDSGDRVTNIVIMGIGEPLDNFDNVLRFLELVSHPKGRGIGMRHITISTCGLAERIDKLGTYNLQLTLSVSLHAPDDETRSRIMPVNRRYPIERLTRAVKDYFMRTGRRVSFEYAMIDGVNDSPEQAESLAKLAASCHAHINLIRLNRVEESPLRPTDQSTMRVFESRLKAMGANYSVRRRIGLDLDAACGQLRSSRQVL